MKVGGHAGLLLVLQPDTEGKKMTIAEIRLRHPEHHDSEGLMHLNPALLDWTEIELLAVGCKHDTTMCHLCLPQWASDYEVKIDGEPVLTPGEFGS